MVYFVRRIDANEQSAEFWHGLMQRFDLEHIILFDTYFRQDFRETLWSILYRLTGWQLTGEKRQAICSKRNTKRWREVQYLIDKCIEHGYLTVALKDVQPYRSKLQCTNKGRSILSWINFANELLKEYNPLVTFLLGVIGCAIFIQLIELLSNKVLQWLHI